MAVFAFLAASVAHFGPQPPPPLPSGYAEHRAALLRAEEVMSTRYQSQPLSATELLADTVLSAARAADTAASIAAGLPSIPATHFFDGKARIDAGLLYPLIRALPKGMALHVHTDSMVEIPWLIAHTTYDPNLYVCGELTGDHQVVFRVAATNPAEMPNPPACPKGSSVWRNVVDMRAAAGSAAAFDALLADELMIIRPGPPTTTYPTLTAVWAAFQGAITAAGGLIFYQGNFQRYIAHAFAEFAGDGLQAIEVRQVLQDDIGCMYTLNGTVLPAVQTVNTIVAAATTVAVPSRQTTRAAPAMHHQPNLQPRHQLPEQQGQNQHGSAAAAAAAASRVAWGAVLPPPPPSAPWLGKAPIIGCALRAFPIEGVSDAFTTITKMAASLPPGLITGFDLVGQEDPGRPLTDFVPMFLEQLHPATDLQPLPFFFHAGETDIVGGAADLNLVDAMLLNTSRIGHGYALKQHPLLRADVKQRGVAIEVCPISNQVLKLVDDLRNHPLHAYLSEGLPVVLSPDDPALWGAHAASYDWAVAYYAMDERPGGLATLKQLAINSIEHSTLDLTSKAAAMKAWAVGWKDYVEWLAALPLPQSPTMDDN